MPVNKTDLWNADLPPLADINGEALLEPHRLPERLREPFDQLLAAVEQGKRVITLNVFPDNASNDNEKNIGTHNTDLYQLALRGIANDPRFKDYVVLSPDDRVIRYSHDYPQLGDLEQHYRRLTQKVRDLEEDGCEDEQIIPALTDKADDNRKGIIYVSTPQITNATRGSEVQLKSKIVRLFGLDESTTIDIQPSAENMYENWHKHALTADVEEVRRLLIEAASSPVKREGVIPKAYKPGPKEFKQQPEQKASEEAVLRLIQRGLFMPGTYCITGSSGRGKTTLLVAAYQLVTQTDHEAFYTRWAAETTSFDNYPASDDQWREVSVRDLGRDGKAGKVKEAVACKMLFIDQAEFGDEKVKEGSKVVAGRRDGSIFMTTNREPSSIYLGRFSLLSSLLGGEQKPVKWGTQVTAPKTYAHIVSYPMITQALEGKDWADVLTR